MGSIPSEDFFRQELVEKLIKNQQEEFLNLFNKEQANHLRPAKEVIMDDQRVLNILGISLRQLEYYRQRKVIGYSQPMPKGKRYTTLQNILDFIEKGAVKPISKSSKF